MHTEKILMIEDDPHTVEIVKMNIGDLGLELEHAGDGQLGLERALSNEFRLVIIDLGIPKLGGMEVCRQIREHNKWLPLLILTSRDEEVSRVLGLELGADDYVTKPFSIAELLARIRSLLRRVKVVEQMVEDGGHEEKNQACVVRGDLVIDCQLRKVTRAGEELELSVLEFDLLLLLASHPGRPFNREELVERVWGYSSGAYERTINAQLSKLRKKLEIDPNKPKYIITVWGLGYKFAENLDS